jgi:GNAT superfamily N-acetyltransferase
MKQNLKTFPTWTRGEFGVVTDPSRLDVNFVHHYLACESYWARGIPRETVERSLANSLCFGVFNGARQVGFARVITDRATYAYLCDVFVAEPARGKKLGVWLIECVLAHPELQGLRWCMLATRDAHGLYRKFGFAESKEPQNLMEKRWTNVYQKAAETKA